MPGATRYTLRYVHPDFRLGSEELVGVALLVGGLSPGSEYRFNVSAVIQSGEVSPSATLTLTLPGGPTTGEHVV